MPQNQTLLNQQGKPQTIHELDPDRLDPANPDSVDPANTDPADEADNAEKTPTESSRPVVTNPDSIHRK